MFENKKPPPPGIVRRTRDLIKATASGFGPVPAAAAEFLDQVLPAFGDRRDEWYARLNDRVTELEMERGITLEELTKNPLFLNAVAQASQAAMRTHQEDKKEALRNAVINSALPGAPGEDQQQMFIGYVERLTPSHLKILRLIAEGPPQPNEREYVANLAVQPLREIVKLAHPELAGDNDFLEQLCGELERSGLVAKPLRVPNYFDSSMSFLKVTDFGKKFLRFISAPTT